MRQIAFVLVAVVGLAGAAAYGTRASGQSDDGAAPIFGIRMPPGYRDWKVISVAREKGSLNDLRAILGNDIAVQAARENRLPFPDGSIVARLAWSYEPLAESAEAFGHPQSFVAGSPTNVQFMVKDSTKYQSSSGWGFAQFNDGKPADEALHKTCLPCHEIVRGRDLVFNRYAP